jgi:hypothetical protein
MPKSKKRNLSDASLSPGTEHCLLPVAKAFVCLRRSWCRRIVQMQSMQPDNSKKKTKQKNRKCEMLQSQVSASIVSHLRSARISVVVGVYHQED